MENDQHGYRKAAIDIFTVTALCVYTWSIIITLWDISGLILHLTAWDLVGYIAYQLTFSLIESLAVTMIVIGFSFLLPKKSMRANLSVSGSSMVFSLAFVFLSFRALPGVLDWTSEAFSISEQNLLAQQIIFGLWLFICLFLFVYAIFMPPKERRIQIVKGLIERFYPLVGLYMVISIFSLLIVVGRNII